MCNNTCNLHVYLLMKLKKYTFKATTMVILPCTSVFLVGMVRYQVEIVGYCKSGCNAQVKLPEAQ